MERRTFVRLTPANSMLATGRTIFTATSADTTFRNGEQLVFAIDTIALMDRLNIDRATLQRAGVGQWYLIENLAANQKAAPPQAELAWWYQYYLRPSAGAPATLRTCAISTS